MNLFKFKPTRTVKGSLALLALACSGIAHAQDSVVDTATHKSFYLANVPDFDQKRKQSEVSYGGADYLLMGLPNNGSEYCAPTSSVNWVSFLAGRGYPKMPLGTGNIQASWTDGIAGLNIYNAVTMAIFDMGVLMHTDAFKGTSGYGLKGLQDYLDGFYPGKFVCSHVLATPGNFPRMAQLIAAGMEGRVVVTVGGWYKPVKLNGVTFYYRNGGHLCSLAAGSWTSTSPTMPISLCNPDNGDSDETVQSPFQYTPYSATPALLQFTRVNSSNVPIPGTQTTDAVDYINESQNWILDGDYVIQPLQGYTYQNGNLWQVTPNPIVDFGQVGHQVQTIPSWDTSTITGECSNAVSGLVFYTTSQSPGAVAIGDPLTGKSSHFYPPVPCRQLLGCADSDPYMLTGDGTIGRVSAANGGTFTQIADMGQVDRIVYDADLNQIGAVKFGDGSVKFITTEGVRTRAILLPAVQDVADATVQMGNGGHLFLSQGGSPVLDELYVGLDGATHTIERMLPDLAGATSFDIDHWNRVYLSIGGQLKVEDLTGAPLKSGFNNRRSGRGFRVARSVSNYDPAIHGTQEWYDRLPNG